MAGILLVGNQKIKNVVYGTYHPPASFVIHGDRFKVREKLNVGGSILQNIDEK